MAPKLYNKFALGVSGAIEAANTFNLVLRIKPLCSELFVIFTTKGLAYSSQEAIAAVSWNDGYYRQSPIMLDKPYLHSGNDRFFSARTRFGKCNREAGSRDC